MNELQRPIEVIETEINFYKTQTATGIIEIGKRLIEAKEQLQHGEWGKWLEEKVDFSQASANRFMRVATEISNSSTLTNLPQSKVFALLDVPKEEREEFIQSNPVNEMTTRELQQAIRDKKDAEKQARELEQQLQRERNKPPQVIEKEVVKEVIPDAFKEKYLELEERAGNLDKAKMELSEYSRKKREIENEMSHLTDTMMDLREKYNEENANSEKQARLITKVRMAVKPIKQAEGEIKQLLRETRELSVAGKSELLSETETLFEIAEAIKKKANEIEAEVIFYG